MSSDAAIDAAEERAGLKNPGYEIFIGALSVLSIANLALHLHPGDPDTSTT